MKNQNHQDPKRNTSTPPNAGNSAKTAPATPAVTAAPGHVDSAKPGPIIAAPSVTPAPDKSTKPADSHSA